MTETTPGRPRTRIVDLLKYGFFFGLGLSLAAWAAYAAAYAFWPKQSCTSSASASDRTARGVETEASGAPEVTDTEEHKIGAQLYFTGVVKNNGAKPINSPQVEVNLFKSGKFVDQYSSYMPGTLAPGESRFFKVACDCRELAHAEYDTYKIRVIGAF